MLCDEANDRCVDCLEDADCPDDGIYCNGLESCDVESGECVSSGSPCPDGQLCDEENDRCVECLTDADCPDDGLFCNGEESCDELIGECVSSGDPCIAPLLCNEETDTCVECLTGANCNDGIDCTNDHCIDFECKYKPDHGACDDGNESTEDVCKEDTGCQYNTVDCPEGQVCDPDTGE
jgi:hypothetical protein